uniref:Uncharacterized protein n=1 Tax=Oryza meridionalis TaxID=40149 RepID=A0A0E0DPH4_9ORYZ
MALAGGGFGGAALGRVGSAAIGSGYGGGGRRLGDLGSATLPPPQHRGGGGGSAAPRGSGATDDKEAFRA